MTLKVKVDVAPSIATFLHVYEATRCHMLEESNLHRVRHYHDIFLEGLRKSMKNLCQVWPSPERDFKLEPLEYEAGDATCPAVEVIRRDDVIRHFIRTDISLTVGLLRVGWLLS